MSLNTLRRESFERLDYTNVLTLLHSLRVFYDGG